MLRTFQMPLVLKICLTYQTRTPLSLLTAVLQIAYGVQVINHVLDCQYDILVKGQGQMCIKSGCLPCNGDSFFDRGYSYSVTQCLSEVYR